MAANYLLALTRDLAHDICVVFCKKCSMQAGLEQYSILGCQKWEKPKNSWVKLNTDVSVFRDKNQAAIGGMVKDSSGKWVWGFSGSIGSANSDTTEMKVLVQGMKVAWERRTPKIIVETDSKNVFNWVQKKTSANHHLASLIKDAKWLLRRPWDFKINLIRREDNMCADKLVKLGYSSVGF